MLSGDVTFKNTGSAAIRGSESQPVNVKLVAEEQKSGYYQILDEFRISRMIPSGGSVTLNFSASPLQTNLPSGTEFSLIVSEDKEYIEGAGGTAFSTRTEPLYTVKSGADVGIESLSYEVLSMDEEYVTVGTEFIVKNTGNERAEGLFVQYTSVKDAGGDGETSVPLDITGSELLVSGETSITDVFTNDMYMSPENGVLSLIDENGENHLSAGYMRTVTGTLKLRRDEFSEMDDEGLCVRCTVYSDSDSYTVNNKVYEKTSTSEYADFDNASTQLIPHKTGFSVPGNICMNLDNTLRVPIAFTSTNISNDIAVREITDGSESWTPHFNEVYYDVSHGAIVATARKTGHTVIQIEDRETNSFREIAVTVKNDGFGINIYKDDDSFTFLNKNGTDAKEDLIVADWEFRENVTEWSGEDSAPMSGNYCMAKKAGAKVTFDTVGTTIGIYYSGKVKVTSNLFPDKVFIGENRGEKNKPLTARVDNLDGKRQTVTVEALTDNTEIDRYTATYPEDTGILRRSCESAPMIYWARCFPNTASLLLGGSFTIDYYVADERGISTVTVNGENVPLDPAGGRLYRLSYSFGGNGEYVFTVTDTDGNTATQVFSVHWFSDIINDDALSEAPTFNQNNVRILDGEARIITKEGVKTEKVWLGTSYTLKTPYNEEFHGYTNGNNVIDFAENEIAVTPDPFSAKTYSAGIDVKRNGFYILRVVSEDGTWSQVVYDVKNLIAPEPAVTVRCSDDGKALVIGIDAQKSKVIPLGVKVNGYEIARPETLSAEYTFPIKCTADYEVTAFDGVYTGKASVHAVREIEIGENAVSLTAPTDGNADGKIEIDQSLVCGGIFVPELSNPAENIYYSRCEYAIFAGEVKNFDGTDAQWTENPVFENLPDCRYTVAVRDPENTENTDSVFVSLGKIPPLCASLNISGKMTKGTTLKAEVSSENRIWGTLSYQWYRTQHGAERPIFGATEDTYTLTVDDYFCNITCKAESSYESGIITCTREEKVTVGAADYSGEYDGKPHTVTFEDPGREDLTVEFAEGKTAEFTDPGEYTVEYSLVSEDGHRADGKAKVTITPRNIENAAVELEKLTYNGKEQNCKVNSLFVGGTEVTDYDMTGDVSCKDAGEYTVTITGKGKFCGSITAKWSIEKLDITGAAVMLKGMGLTYNGEEQYADISSVFIDGVAINDYDITGNTATDAGSYTLRIEGRGNFYGSTSQTWRIKPLDLGFAHIELDRKTFVYTGEEQEVKILSVTHGSLNIPVEELTVSGTKETETGEYRVRAQGSGNYEGYASAVWKILDKNCIESANVYLENAKPTYTGEPISNGVREVRCNGITLDPEDYTVSGDLTATEPGEYTVKVTANFPLEGETSVKWRIISNDLKDAIITADTYKYDGYERRCTVKVSINGETVYGKWDLTGDTKATEAGKYKVTLTGKDGYVGTRTVEWEILPRDISGARITMENLTYSGEKQTAKVKTAELYVNGKYINCTLEADPETEGNTATDCGTYTAAVTGTGNFTGSETVQWKIVPKDISDAEVELEDVYFNGRLQNIKIKSVKSGGMDVTYSLLGTTSLTSVSSGYAVCNIKGTGNFTGEKSVHWNLLPCDFSKCTVTVESAKYTGGEITQRAYIVTPDGARLDTYTYSGDFSVKGNKATERGEYTMTVTSRGKNFTSGEKEATWQIVKRDISEARINAEKTVFLYTDEEKTVNITSVYDGTVKVTDYEVTGQSATEPGEYILTVKGKGNFTGAATLKWSIRESLTQLHIVNAEIVPETLTYNGKEQVCGIRVYLDGEETKNYIVSGNTAKDAGKYTMTVTGTKIFKGESVDIEWEIAPLDISGAEIVTGELTCNGKEQTVKVLSVTVNGIEVSDYTVTGNTAREAGEYTLTVSGFGNCKGEKTAVWKMLPGTQTHSPKTGDTESPAVWAAVMLLSLTVIITSAAKKRKKKK